jgi:hypothetical protein
MFSFLWDKQKQFELRYNDRDFHKGDSLYLREYDDERGYTGRVVNASISYVMTKDNSIYGKKGLKKNYCILSLSRMKNGTSDYYSDDFHWSYFKVGEI